MLQNYAQFKTQFYLITALSFLFTGVRSTNGTINYLITALSFLFTGVRSTNVTVNLIDFKTDVLHRRERMVFIKCVVNILWLLRQCPRLN